MWAPGIHILETTNYALIECPQVCGRITYLWLVDNPCTFIYVLQISVYYEHIAYGAKYRTAAHQKNYRLIILYARKNTEVCGFFLVVFERCRIIGCQERVSLKSWRNRLSCEAGVH